MVADPFVRAFGIVLGFEGRYSNDPADHGGPTNLGVTQATYDNYRATIHRPAQPVRCITYDEAAAIYRVNYWDAHGCGELGWPLALVVFDTFIQHRFDVASDMLRDIGWADETDAVRAFALICLRRNLYRRIVQKDPSQSKFINGWLARLETLRQEAQG